MAADITRHESYTTSCIATSRRAQLANGLLGFPSPCEHGCNSHHRQEQFDSHRQPEGGTDSRQQKRDE